MRTRTMRTTHTSQARRQPRRPTADEQIVKLWCAYCASRHSITVMRIPEKTNLKEERILQLSFRLWSTVPFT